MHGPLNVKYTNWMYALVSLLTCAEDYLFSFIYLKGFIVNIRST